MPRFSCVRGKDLVFIRLVAFKKTLDYVSFVWGSKFFQLGNKFLYIGKSPPGQLASMRVISIKKIGDMYFGRTKRPFNFDTLVRETKGEKNRAGERLQGEGAASLQVHRLRRKPFSR